MMCRENGAQRTLRFPEGDPPEACAPDQMTLRPTPHAPSTRGGPPSTGSSPCLQRSRCAREHARKSLDSPPAAMMGVEVLSTASAWGRRASLTSCAAKALLGTLCDAPERMDYQPHRLPVGDGKTDCSRCADWSKLRAPELPDYERPESINQQHFPQRLSGSAFTNMMQTRQSGSRS